MIKRKYSVFEPELKNKKCKHEWVVLHTKMSNKQIVVEYDYLYCPKCQSALADELQLEQYLI